MLFEVDKGCRHFSPVAELERPFTQPATGHHANGISGATIDFDEGDQTFAVTASWLFDPQACTPQPCQTNAQYLARAKMSMGNSRFFKKFLESGHSLSLL